MDTERARIRAAAAEAPPARERDLAARIGVSEAALLAAHAGEAGSPWQVTPIVATSDRLMPVAQALGEVMALTRTRSCVHERVGRYEDWHQGDHASMVLGAEIDLRIFPKFWAHAYAVEKDGRRSLQVFDAAGDAVHKIFLREGSDLATFEAAKEALAIDAPFPDFAEREAPEPARGNPDKTEVLRREWGRLTDTHQFLLLCRKLKMNRLGANRLAGAPFARQLTPGAAAEALQRLAGGALPVMIFVGNRGCIQIHSGPVTRVEPMGPWLNVLDDRFNLHLRTDHVAEVWAIEKPTKRGPARSLEAFDADGGLIFQIFGFRQQDGADHSEAWGALLDDLPTAKTAEDVA
ncbi:hemin-degrading factor [Salipiger sp. IMCC34102]|nr:hemin-degrading factor [Salipiger sp. IMCC34102]